MKCRAEAVFRFYKGLLLIQRLNKPPLITSAQWRFVQSFYQQQTSLYVSAG